VKLKVLLRRIQTQPDTRCFCTI